VNSTISVRHVRIPDKTGNNTYMNSDTRHIRFRLLTSVAFLFCYGPAVVDVSQDEGMNRTAIFVRALKVIPTLCYRKHGSQRSRNPFIEHHTKSQSLLTSRLQSSVVGSTRLHSVVSIQSSSHKVKMEAVNNNSVHGQQHELGISRRLYSRSSEIETLQEAFVRCTAAERETLEIVLITGLSGTGKTALAYTLQEKVSRAGGVFLSGKYDQLERPEKVYPIINLLNRYFTDLTAKTDKASRALVAAADEIVATEPILMDMLQPFHRLKQLASSGMGEQADKRLNVALCRLFQVIASPERPVVLLLDDLQWAEPASVDLISSLVTLFDIPGLMIMGTMRSNEVLLHQRLSVMLRELDSTGVKVTEIGLQNLSLEDVHVMVADILCVSTDACSSLVSLLYMQTNGNVMFLNQLLSHYVSEGLVYWSDDDQGWKWHYDMIINNVVDVNDSVAFLAGQISRLRSDVKDVIIKASCFGCNFECDLLDHVISHDNVSTSLEILQQRGLVEPLTGSTWRFCHDQIQQSAYSLIPEDEKAEMHLDIGMRLWRVLSPEQLSRHVFLVVDQLRRGAHLVTDEKERAVLAALLLQAGNAAITQSSFALAASHLKLGISMLGRRHWRDHYHLSLNLYDAAAEVENCNGNFEEAERLVKEVLENARSQSDKTRAIIQYIHSLGCRNQLVEAVAFGRDVLRTLGFPLPKSCNMTTILFEWVKTKRQLNRFSDQDILS
jgi:predicted ATPase